MRLGTELHHKALITDKEWQAELELVFGKRAGDARYTEHGKGKPGTKLHRLYAARMAAQKAWHDE